ncbi:acyltransferase family protein [Streptosporangium sp. NPDC002524]|uniref:acyltransferase family protein n=1 Tax=Streptosporangium sp. NPDC002524 TaxID=3154537 RepID=UPI0033280D51
MASLAAGIEAATPESRDRGVDALRALAILGVVLGHWLVTAWAPGAAGAVHLSSPLAHLPEFTPLSWVFQTLAVFFFVGGYAAARGLRSAATRASETRESSQVRETSKVRESATARELSKVREPGPTAPSTPSRGTDPVAPPGSRHPRRETGGGAYPAGTWVRARMGRLLGPVLPLVLVWAGIAAGMALRGTSAGTIRVMVVPAIGPLWFLAVFAALTAAAPLLLRAHPVVMAAVAFAVVLGVDAARFGLGAPAWVGWANLVAGWLVPYALGIAWAGGMLASRRVAAGLLAGGAAGTVLLVRGFGYPASMVGVTGDPLSNLSPPSLAVVCFGLAQVGLALLVRAPLARLMRRPRLWAVVALANLSAMTLFLWHQSAVAVLAVAALRFGDVPGLLAVPDEPVWLLHRLAWFPVFVAVLALVWLPGSRRRRFNDRVSSSA